MNILKTFSSAEAIANADIRSIRKCFEFEGRGLRISLTAEELKEKAKTSIGIDSNSEVIQIKHLAMQIELINEMMLPLKDFFILISPFFIIKEFFQFF